MKDLTEKSIGGHILQMAVPIAAGMLFQTLYFLIDLFFVARIGDAALAGVGAAGNVTFLVFALTQVLGVGTVALISHAVGRKDKGDATLVFNQSLALSATCALVTLAIGYSVGPSYMHTLGADPATEAAGVQYLYWFLPSLALQFAMVVMGSALRGTGIVSFIVPAVWLAAQPSFQLVTLWYVSVASQVVQSLVSLWFVRREFRARLGTTSQTAPPGAEQIAG
jgi:Na+-driven multidrug efflux pump